MKMKLNKWMNEWMNEWMKVKCPAMEEMKGLGHKRVLMEWYLWKD